LQIEVGMIIEPFHQGQKCKWLDYLTLVSVAETS